MTDQTPPLPSESGNLSGRTESPNHAAFRETETYHHFQRRINELVTEWELGLTDLLGEANNLLLRQNEELTQISERLTLEMRQVQAIQESLLPQHLPDFPGLEFASHYLPTAEASGDYYDFLDLSSNHVGILVADVSGHGAASAVVMAIMRVLAQANLNQLLLAGGALSVLNSLMTRFVPGEQFVTAVYSIYNRLTGSLSYATAGHPPPILIRAADKSVSLLPTKPKFPLRLFEPVEYETLEVRLEPGDAVIFYTDGLTELWNTDRELAGEERLVEWLKDSPPETASGILWKILEQASLFTEGSPPVDDFTIVVVRRT